MFTSDHGDMLCSHGLLYKEKPEEESLHISLYTCMPGRVAADAFAKQRRWSLTLPCVFLHGWTLKHGVFSSRCGRSRRGQRLHKQDYERRLRRASPSRLEQPVAISTSVEGSGTAGVVLAGVIVSVYGSARAIGASVPKD